MKYIILSLIAFLVSCKPSPINNTKDVQNYKYRIRFDPGYHMKTNGYFIDGDMCSFVNAKGEVMRVPLYNLTYIKQEARR